jgi:hypothetical protein
MALRCINCGEVCEAEDLVKGKGDPYEFWGETGTTDSYECPSCRWDDFEEVHLCEGEHNYIPIDEKLCDECKQEVANSFRHFCYELSEAEKEFLLEDLLEDYDYVKDI